MNGIIKSLIKENRILKKGLKMLNITFLTILSCIIATTVFLWIISTGKPKPFLDKNGEVIKESISEKCFIAVNGTRQGMFISSIDSSKPVLLFIHGGPGVPEYVISRNYPIVLENCFTVCWWEHRGAGMSFNADIPLETMNFDQFILDAIEVTNYLRKRFKQDKIYLMAHSGGTVFGIQLAARAPQLFHAYVALSQVTNQLESEKLAYKYMVQEFTKSDNLKMLKRFEKYPIEIINTPSYYVMRDSPMHKLGIGTTHKMHSVVTGIFLPVNLCREYTLKEKINFWRGKIFNTITAQLWAKLVETDLTAKVKKLEIPVYFFGGYFDYTTSSRLAVEYCKTLDAPVKAFYMFTNSAHSPMFEEPEKMERILKYDVLNRKTSLSDN